MITKAKKTGMTSDMINLPVFSPNDTVYWLYNEIGVEPEIQKCKIKAIHIYLDEKGQITTYDLKELKTGYSMVNNVKLRHLFTTLASAKKAMADMFNYPKSGDE